MVMVFTLVIMMIVSMFFMSMLVMVVMLMLMFVVMRMFMGVLIMVVMFVHVLIFFNAKCDNTCVGAFDAAFDGLLEVICDIGDSQ